MLPHPRVFARKSLDFGIREVSPKALIQFAREIVVEFREKLNVEKQDGGRCELIGYNVEEDFRAVVFVL